MNNEPVAWMYQIHDITGWTWVIDQRLPDYEYRNEKPLYTHLAKTLTDEEIAEEWSKFYPDVFHTHLIDFARAILRKAQEK
jgi:hypothetical protein